MSNPTQTGTNLIAQERHRQIHEEGWTPEHDDCHRYGGLAVTAATLAVDGTDAYVVDPGGRGTPMPSEDEEGDEWGLLAKHGCDGTRPNRIRSLTIAGALIAAEIDRVLREPDTARDGWSHTPDYRPYHEPPASARDGREECTGCLREICVCPPTPDSDGGEDD
jgi:hypothetical protein